jgi:hypothetical protein
MRGPTRVRQRGAQEDHLTYVARSLQGQDARELARDPARGATSLRAEWRAAQRAHRDYVAARFDRRAVLAEPAIEAKEAIERTAEESLREGISTELASFDKAELRETEVEEKGVLPGSEDIQAERRHMEHMQGLESGLQLRSTQTREHHSSSEEWEKVDSDSEC